MKHEFQINIFYTLFRGREDVFAVRWEKSGKSGYMPAYQYDLYHYRAHKMNGGTFQNYPHKTYLPLTDNEIQKHLNGVQQIGVYPLLQDNTSWFLVADFDKQNWKEEAANFLNSCKEKNIPAYLERSRSGNGGHVWIFFYRPYPSVRSRKVFISILEQSGAFSMFDKSSSFDRLFPNQDFLSGKGFGNLIALPFFKPAMENGNSCFINPETFEPYSNQWQFLNEIERVSIDVLDNLFHEISTTQNLPIPKIHNGKLSITLQQDIRVQRDGLTATPFRKYNDDKLIFAFLGDVISEVTNNEIENFKHAQIIIRNTNLDVPFNSKTDNFETLSKIFVHDSERNKLILNDIKNELSKGKRIAIITERKEHIYVLYLFLKQSYEVVTLSGDDSDANRKSKWQTLQQGNFQILITTGQYFGEGSDLSNISSLFLVYPFSFKGKLIQYIGRVQRSEINPTIYDYRDIKIDYLNKLFLKRNTYYRQIAKQASLFDEPTEFTPERQNLVVEKQIKIAIESLDFRYGNVGFEYIDKESNQRFNFEIENEEFRPEFEVLKPYLIKVLKSKFVVIDIYAELENGVILSQLATSADIENINKEIVESVKFQFLNKSFISQIPTLKQNTLTSDELLKNQNVYANAENILKDLLKGKQYRHSQHIQFLADKHERTVMKLRFVLQPFSFVFLLAGEQNYHIILETLDTEEATYIWHTDKNESVLIDTIKQIDKELNIIREKGRQAYLETNPQNFSRIVHDYSEDYKGFTIWKGQLEERLM